MYCLRVKTRRFLFSAIAKIGTVIMRDQAYPINFLLMEYLRIEQLLMAISKKNYNYDRYIKV